MATLFVAHVIEQMGDSLLKIGEAVISSSLGQVIDIDRYHTLMESIEQFADEEDAAGLVVEPGQPFSGIHGESAGTP